MLRGQEGEADVAVGEGDVRMRDAGCECDFRRVHGVGGWY